MADAVAAAGLDNMKAFDREDRKWRRLQLESALHKKRVYVPKVDPRNPFRSDSQLLDQYELRELNRNPRLYTLSNDRSKGLKRVFNKYGHASRSPRGYVDHLPDTACKDFQATMQRAIPKALTQPQSGVKKGRKKKGRKKKMAASARSGRGSTARSAPSRTGHSKSAPTMLAPSINNMQPPPPSFGHRPSSASRHYDVLTMKASHTDKTDVGRLPIPSRDARKMLEGKRGVGLLTPTDLHKLLGGDAEGANLQVPNMGIADVADGTSAQLLWRTSAAAGASRNQKPVLPDDERAGVSSPGVMSKQVLSRGSMAGSVFHGSLAQSRRLLGMPSSSQPSGELASPSADDADAGIYEDDEDSESQAPAFMSPGTIAAKAAKAKAHRGVVASPKIGVGSGFAKFRQPVVPKYQVTCGAPQAGGLMAEGYLGAKSLETAFKAGAAERSDKIWAQDRTRMASRSLEQFGMSKTLPTPPTWLLGGNGTMDITTDGYEYAPVDSPGPRTRGNTVSFAGPGNTTQPGFDPPGTASGYPDVSSIFEGDGPDTFRAEEQPTLDFTASSIASSKGSKKKTRRQKKRAAKKKREEEQRANAWKEAQWDNSPFYMKPAAKERMEMLRDRAVANAPGAVDVGELLQKYARSSAGAVAHGMMLCEDRYATDATLVQDDLIRLEQPPEVQQATRSYVAGGAIRSSSPRDMNDPSRFTVSQGLQEERVDRERRASIARTEARLESAGVVSRRRSSVVSHRSAVEAAMAATGSQPPDFSQSGGASYVAGVRRRSLAESVHSTA